VGRGLPPVAEADAETVVVGREPSLRHSGSSKTAHFPLSGVARRVLMAVNEGIKKNKATHLVELALGKIARALLKRFVAA
jgi:hypothetical protein